MCAFELFSDAVTFSSSTSQNSPARVDRINQVVALRREESPRVQQEGGLELRSVQVQRDQHAGQTTNDLVIVRLAHPVETVSNVKTHLQSR